MVFNYSKMVNLGFRTYSHTFLSISELPKIVQISTLRPRIDYRNILEIYEKYGHILQHVCFS